MSRIYSNDNLEKSRRRYRETDLGQRFNPVEAQSSEKQVRGYADEAAQRAQTRGRELQRLQNAENLELKAEQAAATEGLKVQQNREKAEQQMQQTYDKKSLELEALYVKNLDAMEQAELRAQATVANAKTQLISNSMQSLLSFSQKGLNYIVEQDKINKQIQDENDSINAIFGMVDLPDNEVDSGTEFAVERDKTNQQVDNATEQSIRSVADNPEQAQDLRQPMQQQQAARQGQRNNVYTAAAALPGYIAGFMNSSQQIPTPDGRVITPNNITNQADLLFVQRYAFSQFAREYGIKGMPREQVARVLVPSAKGILNMNAQVQGARIAKVQTQTARTGALDSAINGVTAGDDVGSTFQRLTSELYTTGMSRGEASTLALKTLIDLAKATRDETILDALAATEKVPGNAGTLLSKGATGVDIENARREIRAGAVQDANLQNAENGLRIREIQDTRLQQLVADGVTPEQETQINQTAIQQLEAMGTAKSLEEAARLRNLGVNYNPFTYSDMQQRQAAGETFTNDQLRTLVGNRDITLEQAKALGYNPKGPKSQSEIIEDTVKPYKTEIAGSARGIVNNVISSVVPNKEKRDLILNTTGKTIAADIQADISRDLAGWLAQNPDANPGQVREHLTTIQEEYRKRIEGSLKYDVQTQVFSGYDFSYGQSRQPVSAVTPTLRNTSGQLARNFTGYTTSEIQQLGASQNTNQYNVQVDQFLTVQQLTAGGIAISNGEPIPPRIQALAKALNMDARTFLVLQSEAHGLKGELNFTPPPAPVVPSGAVGPQSIEQGVSYMQNTLGFPRRGAEYLAANIQQESSWNGMRDWDIGHIDGTDRNGGLVSWQNTASRNHWRLRRIEQYIGKDISQASHAEQLQALKWEMATHYPQSYRIFMNPNATDAQLKRASFGYWGWGEEGANRFGSYLTRAQNAPRTASRPTAAPRPAAQTSSPTIDPTNTGNLNSTPEEKEAFLRSLGVDPSLENPNQ